MTERTTGLRDRKRQRTRAALEAAALRLFAERGFDETTVEQIAGEAEISPRTFFHHFPTKEDVVLADHQRRLERLVVVLADRPDDEAPMRALRSALLEVATDFEAERDAILLRARLVIGNPSVLARSLWIQADWEPAIARTMAARLGIRVDDDVRPRLIAAATLAAMRVAQQRWVVDEGHTPLPALVGEALDLLERGLAPGDAHD
jgi:AcrR family transcriptional regulator